MIGGVLISKAETRVRGADNGAPFKNERLSFVLVWVATVLVAFATISWKLEVFKGIDFGLLMWAEDGVIFLKGAVEHGFSSLWMPYNGYFHAYPRLVAWLSTWTDLHTAPVIFFAGWCLSLLILTWTCARAFASAKLGVVVTAATMVLMLTQPNDGEIFYSLTNAQWFLGVALAFYLFMPREQALRVWEVFLIAVLALTGPFVCVFFPLWFISQWVSKKPKDSRLMAVLIIAFCLQTVCFMVTTRASPAHVSPSWGDWVVPISRFLSLAQGPSTRAFSAVLWLILIGGLVMARQRDGFREGSRGRVAVVLLLAAAGLFAAGLFASRADPAALGPMGGGSRYYFIPYCLVYISIILLADFSKFLRVGVLGLILFINCAAWIGKTDSFFVKFGRVDTQIISRLRLAEKYPDVMIPISPSPDWSFELHTK